MKMVVVFIGLLLLTGCPQLVRDRLTRITSEKINCSAREMQLGPEHGDGFGNIDWTAICRDREYQCQQRNLGHEVYDINCKESPESELRTTRKIVVDRLSLETSCPQNQIEITGQSEWRVGTEQAFRLRACGKDYTCTSAAGRVDCKEALSSK